MNIQEVKWGLEELSDLEFQEKVWTGSDPTQMSSFEEAVCMTFDDTGLGRALDKGSQLEQFTPLIQEELSSLRKLIKKIPANAAPNEVIHHQIMYEIRTVAGTILNIIEN